MTDTPDAAPLVENVEDPAAVDIPQAEDSPTEDTDGHREAKLRKRAQASELERDKLAWLMAEQQHVLTGRIEALQRQQVDAIITAARVKPEAVWKTSDLDSMLNKDGTVNPEAVSAAIDNARIVLGIQPLGKGAYVPSVGHRPDGLPKTTDPFVDAFKPKARK